MTLPNQPGPLPNFLIIGAAKSGTTALYQYLREHPQVFMSAIKEPEFFALAGTPPEGQFRGPGDRQSLQDKVIGWEDYLQLFAAAPATTTARGEASPIYLYSPEAPARIRHTVPQARLIAVLRHPVDRAFSHYLMLRRYGREPLRDFQQALRHEDERVRQGWGPTWHYRRRGEYAGQLERYLALFPRTQLRVYLYDDLRTDSLGLLRDIFRFLEIDDTFTPALNQRHNVGGQMRSSAWHNFLLRPHPLKNLVRPLFPKPLADRLWLKLRDANLVKVTLTPHVRAELMADYRPGILRLQDLLQRDLSPWLKV
jgi:hypothetical protein